MPTRADTLLSGFRRLGEGLRQANPLKSARPLTTDANNTSNSGQASGSDLVSRVLLGTSGITGLGGKLDIVA